MSFLDLAKKRFSARGYAPAPVTDEDLQQVLEAGRLAPSAANRQPCHFLVVRDPERRRALGATMAEQVDIIDGGDLGGTMRLGLYEAKLAEGSLAAELYGAEVASERHRHRYEVNNAFRGQIADAGLSFSGLSPDGELVEYVELPREVHPYYIATQAHPELRSRPTEANPLFRGLIAAALDRHRASELFKDEVDGD